MEKRFDMMDFEESLRDHADRFTLVPTRKVWVGLYNNLHPGSKWPSITMGFLLVLSIIIVGNLNSSKNITSSASLSNANTLINENKISVKNLAENGNDIATAIIKLPDESHQNTLIKPVVKENEAISEQINNKKKSQVHNINSPEFPFKNEEKNPGIANSANKVLIASALSNDPGNSVEITNNFKEDIEISFIGFAKDMVPAENSFGSMNYFKNSLSLIATEPKGTLLPEESAMFNENDNVQKLVQKKNRKNSWTFYLTPSVSSAFFNKSINNTPTTQGNVSYSSPLILPAVNPSVNRKYGGRLSLTAGATSSLPINGKLNFTSGVMVSYLGYKTTSNFIHPTYASVLLMDKSGSPYLKSYITHYGNGNGYNPLQLNNYSLQFAVPIGLQYTLFENQLLNWKIGSSIDPSVVMASKSYILSADGRNYVTDPELLRRFNLLAHFETFLTLKTARTNWQIGPSFGYQTFSTYKKSYAQKEHLIDYGIKIGISR